MFIMDYQQNGKRMKRGFNCGRDEVIGAFLRVCIEEKLSVATLRMGSQIIVRYNPRLVKRESPVTV